MAARDTKQSPVSRVEHVAYSSAAPAAAVEAAHVAAPRDEGLATARVPEVTAACKEADTDVKGRTCESVENAAGVANRPPGDSQHHVTLKKGVGSFAEGGDVGRGVV